MTMYKAKRNFVGKVCMSKGEVKEITDIDVANDLLNAGYIELDNAPVKKEEVVDDNSEKGKRNNGRKLNKLS